MADANKYLDELVDAGALAAGDLLYVERGTTDLKHSVTAAVAALSALTPAADKIGYFTSAGAAATTDFTSVARTLNAQTTQALMRTTGLGLGTLSTQAADAVAITGGTASGITSLGLLVATNTDLGTSVQNSAGTTVFGVQGSAAYGALTSGTGKIYSGSDIVVMADGASKTVKLAGGGNATKVQVGTRILSGSTLPTDDGATPWQHNGAMSVAGTFTGSTITATTRINHKSYTVATLPAVGVAAGEIYVSDEVGGAVLAFSDAINWRRVTDRAVVA